MSIFSLVGPGSGVKGLSHVGVVLQRRAMQSWCLYPPLEEACGTCKPSTPCVA